MSNSVEKAQGIPQKVIGSRILSSKLWWGFLFVLLLTSIGSTTHAMPVTNLNVPRRGHSATLLHDGRIVVIGGWDHIPNEPITDTTVVEIYNPHTNSWSLAASLPMGHTHHTATVLPDGRVLVAGGSTGGEIQAFANLYDPKTDSWSDAADLSVARVLHTATLLKDGRVLVTGGNNNNGDRDIIINDVEIYDPTTDSWSDAAYMNSPRVDHSATLLSNGHIVVIGGSNSGGLNLVEIYDPITDSWEQAESSVEAHEGHTATLLPDGRILIAGGTNENYFDVTTTVELYDPNTDSWTSAASLSEARTLHSATLLPDGTVLIAGGDDRNDFPNSVERYDPDVDVWTTIDSLAEPRADQTMTLLPDGRVLVAGGYSPDFFPVSIWGVEILNPLTSRWLPAASPTHPRSFHTTTMLPNGRLLVVGGGDFYGYLTDTVELYDIETDSWVEAPSLGTERADHTATMMPNNNVLVVGGRDSNGAIANADLYNPTANNWTPAASLEAARYRHTATLLQNGRVLIAGGVDGMYNNVAAMTDSVLYEPYTDTWIDIPDLNTPRYWASATRLRDGRILVAGGRGFDTRPITNSEIFDPATNSWSISADLTAASSGHSATLLPDGQILVIGGRGSTGAPTDRVERYDPDTDTWTLAAPLSSPRFGHSTTLLPNGQVLVVGGYNGRVLRIAELYDPALDSWTAVSSPSTYTFDHTATLLPSGQILVVGGRDIASVASAELYDPGLGFDDAWRPIISTIRTPFLLDTSMEITGHQFRGISDASGGGSFNDSATDYPLVQLYSLANEQFMWLNPAAGIGWSDEHFTSITVDDFPIGPAFVTIFTNAIPSQSAFIQVVNEERTLTVRADGGSVTSSLEGIDCGEDCSEAYAYGTAVSLTPIADENFMFTGWSGACSGIGECELTLDADRDVAANFKLVDHRLTVAQNGTGSGTVISLPDGINCQPNCSEAYSYGTVVTLTAVADTGSTFTGWHGGCSGTDNCIITIDEEKSIAASFTRDEHMLTVDTVGPGTGSVISTPDGIDCGLNCSEVYAYGTVVTLTAIADVGASFTGWHGDCSGTGDCVVTMDEAKNVTATFMKYVLFLPVFLNEP